MVDLRYDFEFCLDDFNVNFFIQDETETISDSEEEDENNNNTKQNSTGLVISNTYSYIDLTEEDTKKTNSNYDDTKDLLKILNNETIEKSTNFKPDSELSMI